MIVNLIKNRELFSITLPEKVKGQYWINDIGNDGESRQLIGIEAHKNEWILKSNKRTVILDKDSNPVKNTVLKEDSFFNLRIEGETGKVLLFCEPISSTRYTFKKLLVKGQFRSYNSYENERNKLILTNQSNTMLIYDLEKNAWWKWELPVNVFISQTDQLDLKVINKTLLIFEDAPLYYDFSKSGERIAINWQLVSQPLHFNAPTHYKNIKQLIFQFRDSDTSEKTMDAQIKLYRSAIRMSRTTTRGFEEMFRDYPRVFVSPAQAKRFQNGGALDVGRIRKNKGK